MLFTRINKSEEVSHQFSRAPHHLWGKAETAPEYTHPEKIEIASFLPMHLVAVQILKPEAKYCEDEDSKINQVTLLMLASCYCAELKGCI